MANRCFGVTPPKAMGQPFDDYIAERLALKNRQYNSVINDPEQDAKRQAQEVEAQARAYRKASGS